MPLPYYYVKYFYFLLFLSSISIQNSSRVPTLIYIYKNFLFTYKTIFAKLYRDLI